LLRILGNKEEKKKAKISFLSHFDAMLGKKKVQISLLCNFKADLSNKSI